MKTTLAHLGKALALSLLAANVQAADLTVQIGAFGVQPNAKFTTQAAEHGEVLVLRGDDGITRVSIGRYPTRSAARAALARLQIAGYQDAYVANVRGTTPSSSEATSTATATPAASRPAASRPARTMTNPTTAGSQRLPSGEQIVTPKRPDSIPADDSVAQAGRFRLRTHDTQSGQTTDVQLSDQAAADVSAGRRFNQIPTHLREKLVYLDGVPHIKDGDKFIPLTDAVDDKP